MDSYESAALAWTLYQLESPMAPMGLALAETDAAAYLVLLAAPGEELDALVETVFFPAVEALTPVGGADVGFAIDPQAPFEEQMQAILDQAVEMGTPGAAMYVETAGGQVWLGASGKAILETGVDLSASDKFWIYSASKTFVAAVVMQLVEEGVLALDDPISDWLEPSLFASIPNGEAITIRMLLNHTSGIYDHLETEEMRSDMIGNPGQVWEPQELVQHATMYGSPYAEPGGALSYYANTNYVLLGLIIEQATGSPLATEIRNRILTPLNLENTYAWEEGVPGGHVSGYTMLNGERVDVSDLGLSWAWAAGGLVSNVEDTAAFSKALFSGELFQQPETLDEMLAFVERYNQPGGYGLGVVRADFLSPVSSVPMIIDGNGPGFVSVGAHWLSTGETAVVLLNTDDDDLKFAILFEAIQAAELGQ
jgi:D-alanyl-D-alanine carboxypeptidase